MDLRRIVRIGGRVLRHPTREWRRAWFRLRHARAARHDLVCRRAGFRIAVPSDSVLAEPLYVGSGFEDDEAALVRRLARRGMRVLDVGANVGLYSVMLAVAVGPSGSVWSFEPFPPSAGYLKRNLALNGLTNVTVVEKAAADRSGTLELHVFPEGYDVYNSLGASVRPRENLRAVRRITVRATTLDGFADEAGIDAVDLVKVDVEGAEERVLVGAERLLSRSPRAAILTEFYAPSAEQCQCSTEGLIDTLRRWGFSMYAVQPGGRVVPWGAGERFGVYALFQRKAA